ncbi:YceH family protein [Lysobacter solisilvae (ex Woo and Kim 2020)]|uniref:YceH family protein n=1 Tax=Agrilutibacter terrestris TaxID=2865112 RepID=A0A7H0FZ38_9GAMM|nr:YceH family protein [Lysobacter terrestris]QNP41304.1 YceH family protein [Lysobacter terrestris]
MSEESPSPAPRLSPLDARILGALVEKEATTPDAYPLTLNALVLACNQKTAREPLMELDADAVAHALRQLEPKGWVKSQHSSRAERYTHRVERVLEVTQPQCALLALLMLRGPQTAHELLTRSERMAKFESADDVVHALDRLASRGLATVLPRQSGQRGDRYAHLLCGEPDAGAFVQEAPMAGARGGLAERVAELEARVAELEARLAALAPGDAGA